ncbi:MAG: ABC transporter permease [Spirochaetaceae bacterium]
MKIGWPFYIAKRYVKAGKGKSKITPARLSAGGIAVGVAALITVIGVMNGFQLNFIENILSIHSFHIRIYGDPGEADIEDIKELSQVESVLPFRETQSLIQGGIGDYRSCVIRGVPPDFEDLDPDMVERLNVVSGELDLRGGGGIVIGAELANRLGVKVGDAVHIVAMSGDSFSSLRPSDVEFQVRGIFRSGYFEFDAGFAFIGRDSIESIASKGTENIIGLKLKDRFKDAETAAKIEGLLPEGYSLESWREYNRAFFGALRMEKLAMMLLIGLIFIVVGVNIKNSLERSVMEKRDEIAVLRALGASGRMIRTVFVSEGLVIGLSGAVLGSIGGLLITEHINSIFSAAEMVVNRFLLLSEYILAPLFGSYRGEFSLFSPAYFYIQEVPTEVLYSEFFLIMLFAVISSTAAAYAASRRTSEIYIAEILRNE